MIKVTSLQEMNHIENGSLQMHIREKAEAISEMEFVEMFSLKENVFLHGVRIIDESYGEDIYLPVEVVRC